MSIVRKKLVAVGDAVTGKTCLLEVFTKSQFPKRILPTVFNSYAAEVVMENQHVDLQIEDTSGLNDYDKIRPLVYPGSDVVLIVFSISEPASLENVKSKWIEEVRHFLPNIPVILVGNKKDVRGSYSRVAAGSGDAKKLVTTELGMDTARRIKALSYLECSALYNEGVQEVFYVAAGEISHAIQFTDKKQCTLL